MATCYRDQRKLGQVIDQMKILANNMDELRAEINVFRNSYLKSKENHSCASVFETNSSSETNVLSKLKKYMRKVTSIYSLRKGQKYGEDQETYYPCTNMDPRLPSFLSYIFRTRKKGNLLEIPTRIKYLKSRGIQTNGKLESRQRIANSPAIIPIENDDGFLFAKHENERYNEMIFPKRYATLVPHRSEISCELDFQIESPMASPFESNVNIFSDSYSFKNYPDDTRIVLSDSNDKQSAAKHTQTKIVKLRKRKSKHLNFHREQSNLCFSKIKNAVITKKIIRNSNERTFTVCGEVNDVKEHPRLKKNRCKQCSCGKRRNNFTQWNDQKDEENLPVEKTVQRISGDLSMNMFENISPTTKPDLSSSLLSLDINISNSSNNVENFPERRKPRTYVIRQATQKCNQNNCSSNFEKSVICLEQTSDLILSSCSFSNREISISIKGNI